MANEAGADQGYWDPVQNRWIEPERRYTPPPVVIPTDNFNNQMGSQDPVTGQLTPYGSPSNQIGQTPNWYGGGSTTNVGGTSVTVGGSNSYGMGWNWSDPYATGGYGWQQMALQAAQFNAEMAYKQAVFKGQSEQEARRMADQEMNTSLKRSQMTGYIDGNPTLDRDIATWAQQNQQDQTGLQYLQTLSQQRGPRDWMTYANTMRNAQGSNLPAYANALVTGKKMSAFGSTLGTTNGSNSFNQQTYMPGTGTNPNASWINGAKGSSQYALPGVPTQPAGGAQIQGGPSWLQQAQQGAQGGQQAQWLQTMQTQNGQNPTWARPQAQAPVGFNVNAIKVRPDQWANMSPVEKEMLRGQIENSGGDPGDWEWQMQQAAPKGRAIGMSSYGF